MLNLLDLNEDIIEVIKKHVCDFKDDDERYNFLYNFTQNRNNDLYKFFFNKDSYFFKIDKSYEYYVSKTYFVLTYFIDEKTIDLKELINYVNTKYNKNVKHYCSIINMHFGSKSGPHKTSYIDIDNGNMRINSNNTLQICYQYVSYCHQYWSKEYNLPKNIKDLLNDKVWNIDI
mmetsp:Transcript_21510/g.59054  ORF Transcript_21510/g.59054 Transcript_21510/m.59054 type:complete len:174 (+) Transcript_21510:230-751(+)